MRTNRFCTSPILSGECEAYLLHGENGVAVAVVTSPEMLAIDLRTYGEDDAAGQIEKLSESELEQIFERADHYLYGPKYSTRSGASPYPAWALSMAAVEFIEGRPRPLRRKRRKLRGIYPGC